MTASYVKGGKPGLSAREIFGIRTAGAAENPLAERQFMKRQSLNEGLSGSIREKAGKRLTALDAMSEGAAGRASGERVAGLQAQGAQARVDAILAGQATRAEATKYAADQGRAAKENVAGTAAGAATTVATTKAEADKLRTAATKENQDRLAKVREASLALQQGQQYQGPEFTVGEIHQDPTTGVISQISDTDERGAPKYTMFSPNAFVQPGAPAGQPPPAAAPVTAARPSAAAPAGAATGRAPSDDEARNILAAAGGDKTLARDIAKRRGFTL